jgi:dTMP kinase
MTVEKTAGDGREARTGILITFEGTEGCGKSTQAGMLAKHLREGGSAVLLVREPGGTPAGTVIRRLLLDPEVDIEPVTEALLFAADRAQQVSRVVLPALESGKTVISDRYVDSSLAYQGIARGCGLEVVTNLNAWATGGLEPDLTVILDVPVEQGLARQAGRKPDRMELESREFHEKVRSAYASLTRLYAHRMVLVDGAGSPGEVHQRVLGEVQRVMGGRA